MGFGHIYVDASQASVLDVLDRHLASKGMKVRAITPAEHPNRTKEVDEAKLRLFWIAPRIGRWTGVFEFRYYSNASRPRWGYTDEELAVALSRELKADTWRLEVVDQAGFWLYARYAEGQETEGTAYHDTPADRSLDPNHKRYALNRIVEREKFPNLGLGYENIPGPSVRSIEAVPQKAAGIEALEGFVHRAYSAPDA
jgi:hypothetical protein